MPVSAVPARAAASRAGGAAYAGMFLFGIVMALLGAVLPRLSEAVQFGLEDVGTLFLVMNLCILATSLALGPPMDRFGTKPPLVIGPALVGAGLLLLATAGTFAPVVWGVAVLGVGGGAVNAASNTLVADLHADPAAKSAALNRLGVVFGFGALLLPFSMGLLLETLGLPRILASAAGLCALVALTAALPTFPPPKQATHVPLSQAARFLRDPVIRLFAVLFFFESANEFILGGYVSTLLSSEIGVSLRDTSWVVAAYWAALMVARMGLSRLALRVPGPQIVIGCAVLAALGTAVLASARTPGLAVAATVFSGAAMSGIFTTALGIVGARYGAYTGTVFGLLFTAALTGGVTLPWVAGQLAAARGVRAALWLAAGSFLAVAALQGVAASRLREVRS